jgi:hypothetical protein
MSVSFSFRARINAARRDSGLYFSALLPEQFIEERFADASGGWRGWIYTRASVIWCFLSQVLSADHSCRETVAKFNAFRVANGLRPCSADTGAYCIARDKLEEDGCQRLIHATAQRATRDVPDTWQWEGRRVRVVDGSTATMADTPANRAEYPQVPGQKPGCGFPILRFIVIFCLATGVALEMALGKYEGKQTGEGSLFRGIADVLEPNDVLLADRCFSGWFDIVLQMRRGVDVVVRKHQKRHTDFRRGQRLGHDDHLVTWPKTKRPEWMDQDTYDSLPSHVTLREIRVVVATPGFRTRVVIVVTTLTDAETYHHDALASLYRQRWQAELHLRSLKTIMQMDHLRCKEPHRVRNELRMHLVAYNLIREVIAEAARCAGTEPWHLSFKGAMQTLNHFLPQLSTATSTDDWIVGLLQAIATHDVGNRPGRVEPRVRKRRPKPYPLMTKPRPDYKTSIAA